MRKVILVVTVFLFALGITSAFLILYDSMSEQKTGRPALLDKEHAYSIAVKAGNWTQSNLDRMTVDMTFLHVKNDGFAFYVDEKTLEDKDLFWGDKFTQLKEGQYLWIVKMTAKDGKHGSDYFIDASDGTVLRSSDPLFSSMGLEVFGSYSPLTIKDHFLKGWMKSVTPMPGATVSIFVNDIPVGQASVDPDGCFQYDDWDDSELKDVFDGLVESDKKNITHVPAELKFTAVYYGDENHSTVSVTKNSYLYLGLVPLAWPSYTTSVSPNVIHLKPGESTDFDLAVQPNSKEAEVEHMVLNMQRLPCGVSWSSTDFGMDPNFDNVLMNHTGAFHLTMSSTNYAKPGKYFVEIMRDTSGSKPVHADSIIRQTELEIAER